MSQSTSFLLQLRINLRTDVELCLVISLYLKISIALAFQLFLKKKNGNGKFQKHRGEYKTNAPASKSLGVDTHKHKCVNTRANSLHTQFIFMLRHDPDNNSGGEIFQTKCSVA